MLPNIFNIKKYQTCLIKIVHNSDKDINHIFNSFVSEWNHNVAVLPNVTQVLLFHFKLHNK